MTIEERIQAILIGAAGVTALVPASRIRVAAPGGWQDIARPYVVHKPVALRPVRTYDRLEGPAGRLYQISVFGDKTPQYSGIALIRDAIIAAVDGTHPDGTTCFLNGGGNPVDDENPGLIQIPTDFLVFASL